MAFPAVGLRDTRTVASDAVVLLERCVLRVDMTVLPLAFSCICIGLFSRGSLDLFGPQLLVYKGVMSR